MGLKPIFVFIPLGVMLIAIALGSGVSAVSGQGPICANSTGQTVNCFGGMAIGTHFTLGAPCPTYVALNNAPSGTIFVTSCTNSIGNNFPSETVVLAFPPPGFLQGTFGWTFCISSPCNMEIYPVTSITFFQVNLGADILASCTDTVIVAVPTSWSCTSLVPYGQQNGATSGLFSFVGSVGLDSNGWIILAIALIGIATIAGVTVLSTGLQSESIHIFFVAGGLAAIWTIIVLVEGFPGQNEVFFNSINSLMASAGTALFMLMTMIYAVGIFTAISRGV